MTIMGSGRIDGRQERGVREILLELPVTDQRLWHHSPVIPAAPGLGPVTAEQPEREDAAVVIATDSQEMVPLQHA